MEPLGVRREDALGPHWAIGITGQPVARAMRAAPVLPVIGHKARVASERALGVDDDSLSLPIAAIASRMASSASAVSR